MALAVAAFFHPDGTFSDKYEHWQAEHIPMFNSLVFNVKCILANAYPESKLTVHTINDGTLEPPISGSSRPSDPQVQENRCDAKVGFAPDWSASKEDDDSCGKKPVPEMTPDGQAEETWRKSDQDMVKHFVEKQVDKPKASHESAEDISIARRNETTKINTQGTAHSTKGACELLGMCWKFYRLEL